MSIDNTILDSGDTYELLIKHLIRDRTVFNLAKERHLESSDFLSGALGNPIYKVFVDIIYAIGESPIDKSLLLTHIIDFHEKGEFLSADKDNIVEFWESIYQGILNVNYVKEIIPLFIKRRRLSRITQKTQDPEKLAQELNKCLIQLESSNVSVGAKHTNPFVKGYRHKRNNGILTGFAALDKIMGGFMATDLVFICGYTGCGKTMLAINILLNIALQGFKVLFFTAEQPYSQIQSRICGNYFSQDHNRIRSGELDMEIDDAIDRMPEAIRLALSNNIYIDDVSGEAPVSAEWLRYRAEAIAMDGFIPEIVIYDQFNFLEPNDPDGTKGKNEWKVEEQIAHECLSFAKHSLLGEHNFAMIVLVQAMGDPKKKFSRKDMAGAKGKINPATWAFGLGRDGLDSDEFNLFSLKNRNSSYFEIPLIGDGRTMRFKEMNAPGQLMLPTGSQQLIKR